MDLRRKKIINFIFKSPPNHRIPKLDTSFADVMKEMNLKPNGNDHQDLYSNGIKERKKESTGLFNDILKQETNRNMGDRYIPIRDYDPQCRFSLLKMGSARLKSKF